MIRTTGRGGGREAREFVRWVGRRLDIRSRVVVEFYRGQAQGFAAPAGMDYWHLHIQELPTIAATLDTVAHEMVHIAQDEAGRPINDRGVAQRAAALVRQWRRGEAA